MRGLCPVGRRRRLRTRSQLEGTPGGSNWRLEYARWSTALLRSRSLGKRPGATGFWVKNTLAQGPFGIEIRRKCCKIESFEGKGTEALPQSFYCTSTAIRRKYLITNGAGEGNRTLVSIGTDQIIKNRRDFLGHWIQAYDTV